MLTEVTSNTATCGNPQDQVSDVVQVLDFMEPAVEENTVSFVCPLRLMLNGPSTSTCISGSWFPNPTKVKCAGKILDFRVIYVPYSGKYLREKNW